MALSATTTMGLSGVAAAEAASILARSLAVSTGVLEGEIQKLEGTVEVLQVALSGARGELAEASLHIEDLQKTLEFRSEQLDSVLHEMAELRKGEPE
ncbi:MAG: hypothetical protein QF848_15405 [Planctomycetota bacterium]|jgi:chromosome segregation ATPase|nr:hypothetical protein [Planctomycetota bacterium]